MCAKASAWSTPPRHVLHTGHLACCLFGASRAPGCPRASGSAVANPNPPCPRRSPEDQRLLAQFYQTLRESSGNVSACRQEKLHISRQRAYRLLAGRTDAWGTGT